MTDDTDIASIRGLLVFGTDLFSLLSLSGLPGGFLEDEGVAEREMDLQQMHFSSSIDSNRHF